MFGTIGRERSKAKSAIDIATQLPEHSGLAEELHGMGDWLVIAFYGEVFAFVFLILMLGWGRYTPCPRQFTAQSKSGAPLSDQWERSHDQSGANLRRLLITAHLHAIERNRQGSRPICDVDNQRKMQ